MLEHRDEGRKNIDVYTTIRNISWNCKVRIEIKKMLDKMPICMFKMIKFEFIMKIGNKILF